MLRKVRGKEGSDFWEVGLSVGKSGLGLLGSWID